MSANEHTFVFECAGSQLIGVLHGARSTQDVGVVIVVGGPQYRVGSHRQFVLLARELAQQGFATLRFDYRGMGDSDGALRGFENIDADIRAALDEFQKRVPAIKRFVLWGLCDGATATSFYAHQDARIAGLVLLNPWIRSSQTLAKSLLKGYYGRRLLDPGAWRGVLKNPKALVSSVASVLRLAGATAGMRDAQQELGAASAPKPQQVSAANCDAEVADRAPLADRMAEALGAFEHPILLILSGADITANEFIAGMNAHARLRRRLTDSLVTRRDLFDADHTFSRAAWRNQVAAWTAEWLIANFGETQAARQGQ